MPNLKTLLLLSLVTALGLPLLAQDPSATKDDAAPKVALPKAEDVLEAFVTATGGREAYEKLTSTLMVWEGELKVPNAAITIQMTMKGAAPNLMSRHMTMKGTPQPMEESTGFDGKNAWKSGAMTGEPTVLEGAELAEFRRESTFSQEIHWKTLYKEVRTKEVKKVNGRDCAIVELIPEEGKPVVNAYDLESKLLVRTEMVPAGQSGQKSTLSFSEWKDVGGVKFPHALKIAAGMMPISLKATKLEVNVPFKAEDFAMPAKKAEAPVPPGGGQ